MAFPGGTSGLFKFLGGGQVRKLVPGRKASLLLFSPCKCLLVPAGCCTSEVGAKS